MKYDESLKKKILKLIELRPMNYGQCCASSTYHDLGEEIRNAVPKLSSDQYSFKTRIYWILNDIDDFPRCEICHGKVLRNVWTLENGYRKYGHTSITCSEECRKVAQHQTFEKTCLDRYGVTNVYAAESVKETIRQKNLLLYGIENGGNTKEGRLKAKQTIFDHFGEDGLSSPIIREHKRLSCQSKYGKNHHTQTDEYKERCQAKTIQRYVFKLDNDPELEVIGLNNLSCDITYDDLRNKKFNCKCKKCGNEFIGHLSFGNFYNHGTYSSCNRCHPHSSSSTGEKEIIEFLKSIYSGEILTNKRTIIQNSELDIYIPQKNLAIEYDGIYWHSEEAGTPKMYHLSKTEKCENKNIHLIHIFENEWKDHSDIVKSRLKDLLGLYDHVVFARKCFVREVDSKDSRIFQKTNHIQGDLNSRINLGLYFDGDLVALMTFSKPRFDKKHEWEMLRFCCKIGYHIPGAAGKLLKYFERNYKPKSIVSYADRRWSQGKLYKALGFKLDHMSDPNYWYIGPHGLESRVKYQKHKLKNILKVFDENLSEVENMRNNKFKRIFDCGNLVFVKNYEVGL